MLMMWFFFQSSSWPEQFGIQQSPLPGAPGAECKLPAGKQLPENFLNTIHISPPTTCLQSHHPSPFPRYRVTDNEQYLGRTHCDSLTKRTIMLSKAPRLSLLLAHITWRCGPPKSPVPRPRAEGADTPNARTFVWLVSLAPLATILGESLTNVLAAIVVVLIIQRRQRIPRQI